jgi:hypothetical protein
MMRALVAAPQHSKMKVMTCNTGVGRLGIPFVQLVRTVLGPGLLIALPLTLFVAAATSLAGGAMGVVRLAGVERPFVYEWELSTPRAEGQTGRHSCGLPCAARRG